MRKQNKIYTILLVASILLLSFVSTASAAFDDEEEEPPVSTEEGGNSMTKYADVDPIAKPYTTLVAENMPKLFALAGICLLLWEGFWAARDKDNNKLDKSSDHKNGLHWAIKMLGLTLLAVSVFQAAIDSDIVGIF